MIETTLPTSGKTARLRRPTGRDLVQAELLCGEAGKQVAFQMAILSRITEIEGKTLPYEDLLELDAEDLTHLGKLDPTPKKEESPAPS